MADKVRWGILGTGSIAHKFADSLAHAPNGQLAAVGSRKQETAEKFGDEYDIDTRHGSYEDLANDPNVDAIYVSSPHSAHMDNTLLCLDAGKAVLCEKPFAINAEQAKTMVARAREKGVFLMEAMWTRFFPINYRVREILADGTLGDICMVSADFGFRGKPNPESRLFNPALGGGALLDVGIYPISYASMVYGGEQPQQVLSMTRMGETNVDELSAVLFGYESGGMASLYTALRVRTLMSAEILGTEGNIRIEPCFWKPAKATVTIGGETETLDMPYESHGYQFEAIHVGECLAAGKLESDVIPLDESVAVMETLDSIREQWGLTYPME